MFGYVVFVGEFKGRQFLWMLNGIRCRLLVKFKSVNRKGNSIGALEKAMIIVGILDVLVDIKRNSRSLENIYKKKKKSRNSCRPQRKATNNNLGYWLVNDRFWSSWWWIVYSRFNIRHWQAGPLHISPTFNISIWTTSIYYYVRTLYTLMHM